MIDEKKIQSKLCWNENNEEAMFRWGMREALARKNSSNVWGQSYLFQTQDKKIQEKFKRIEKLNNLHNFFSFVEREVSKYGRAIITLNKTKSGDVFFNLSSPMYFSGVGKVFYTPQLAVIYQRFDIDNKSYVVKSTYDTKKVRNEFFTSDTNELLVMDERRKVMEYLQMEEVWYHNLGFVPIMEITNLSYYDFTFNQWQYLTIADWYPATQYEELAYRTFIDLEKELYLCHSRIVGTEGTQQLINQLKSQAGNRIDIGDFIIETEVGSEVKIMNGNGDFMKYINTLDGIFDTYFKLSGLSRFSEGGGAQKTVAETASIRSQMIETINHKIRIREKQVKELLAKALAIYGVVDYFECEKDFDFKINGNILKDDTQYIDNQIKKMEVGAITIIDFIQDLRNVSEEEAKEIYEKNKKFMEENDEFLKQHLLGVEESENERTTNDMGQHQEADKKGEA